MDHIRRSGLRAFGDSPGPDMIAAVPPEISFAEKPTRSGELVLLRPVRTADAVGFRILLPGPAFCGRRLRTEASRLALANAFRVVGLQRIDLEVYAFNPRARRVYERIGLVHEGSKRPA